MRFNTKRAPEIFAGANYFLHPLTRLFKGTIVPIGGSVPAGRPEVRLVTNFTKLTGTRRAAAAGVRWNSHASRTSPLHARAPDRRIR